MKNQDWNTQIKKNTKNLAFWSLSWTLSMALATFGPMYIWENNNALTLIGVILNALLGVGVIFANIRQLNGLDDLQKKIQLEAMGIALGVGIVGGLSFNLLDTTNLIPQDAEISQLVILIGLTYLVSIFIGQKRYK
tara:strand:- start:658 stop:1065 length:408 start_codon:yes stop_codon:yes gene_type:complete